MNSKIKFVVVDNEQNTHLPSLDLDIIDADDEVEKQILIGLGIELDGQSYTVINQIIEANDTERHIVYYVQAMAS